MLKKNIAYSAFGQVSTACFNFWAIYILLATYGMTRYSSLVIAQSLILFIDNICNPHNSEAYVEIFSTKQLEEKKEVLKIVGIEFLISIFSLFVCMFVAFFLGKYFNWSYLTIICIYDLSYTLLFNVNGIISGFIRYQKKFLIISVHSIIFSAIYLLLIILVYYNSFEFEDVIKCISILNVIKNIVLFYIFFVLLKNMCRNREEDNKQKKGLLSKLAWCHLTSIVDSPVQYLDTIFIAKFSTNISGIYKIICQFLYLFSLLGNCISQVYLPEFSNMIFEKEIYKIKNILSKVSIISLLISLVLYIIFLPILVFMFLKFLNLKIIIFIALVLILNLYSFSTRLVHVLFVSFGFFKQNFYITLITNFLYVLIIYVVGRYLDIYSVVFANIIQVILNVKLKKYIINRRCSN